MFCGQDAVLLAVETLLITLYGSCSAGNEDAAVQLGVKPQSETHDVHKDAETSLPASANTSSSSSSDDWIVNRSTEGPDAAQDSLPAQSSAGEITDEISAESWTKGTAFTDPVSGRFLEPVQIHSGERTDVIVKDISKHTAYDLIGQCPGASLEDVAAAAVKEGRKNLGEEDGSKYVS